MDGWNRITPNCTSRNVAAQFIVRYSGKRCPGRDPGGVDCNKVDTDRWFPPSSPEAIDIIVDIPEAALPRSRSCASCGIYWW